MTTRKGYPIFWEFMAAQRSAEAFLSTVSGVSRPFQDGGHAYVTGALEFGIQVYISMGMSVCVLVYEHLAPDIVINEI